MCFGHTQTHTNTDTDIHMRNPSGKMRCTTKMGKCFVKNGKKLIFAWPKMTHTISYVKETNAIFSRVFHF